VAHNGADALRLAQELQPDLVLLDIHMPEMDGFEVIRTLRAHRYTGIVTACSASVSVRDSDSTIEAGCDYFISKPVDITFEETIATILSA
jgi:two-component system, sensor histidine kinase and response regulator